MVIDKLIQLDTHSARVLRAAGGTILAVMTLIWVLVAAIEWVDIVPGNLAVLKAAGQESSAGDARYGIFLATLGVAVPLAYLALATAVLRGCRRAVTAAVVSLAPLTVLSAFVLSYIITPRTVFNLLGVVASFVLVGWSLIIERRSVGLVVSLD